MKAANPCIKSCFRPEVKSAPYSSSEVPFNYPLKPFKVPKILYLQFLTDIILLNLLLFFFKGRHSHMT